MSDELGAAAPDLSAWIGREETRSDVIDRRTAHALAATLDYEAAEVFAAGELPPLWHWAYFTPSTRRCELGPDGHARRGGFLPPVALPNRMWAGGRLRFQRPLRIGESARRLSRILRCEHKRGRSGELVFVTVEHTISGQQGVALVEEHDIVYRQRVPGGGPLAGEMVAQEAQFRQHVHPDPVLLFRYSALTFNGHRIHYDHPYATGVEGYPGLVFHGPLTATLLLDAFRAARPGKRITGFTYRALGPLFGNTDFALCGRMAGAGEAHLWTDCEGRMTMSAEVAFSG